MLPEMRRRDHILSPENTELLLQKSEYGVLPTTGEGYPYGVPVSYVYENEVVYIYHAIVDNKLENIIGNPKVSLCVVGATQVLSEDFTANCESMALFGKAEEVFVGEKRRATELLVQKYSSGFMQEGLNYIRDADSRIKAIEIATDHLTGKSRKQSN